MWSEVALAATLAAGFGDHGRAPHARDRLPPDHSVVQLRGVDEALGLVGGEDPPVEHVAIEPQPRAAGDGGPPCTRWKRVVASWRSNPESEEDDARQREHQEAETYDRPGGGRDAAGVVYETSVLEDVHHLGDGIPDVDVVPVDFRGTAA